MVVVVSIRWPRRSWMGSIWSAKTLWPSWWSWRTSTSAGSPTSSRNATRSCWWKLRRFWNHVSGPTEDWFLIVTSPDPSLWPSPLRRWIESETWGSRARFGGPFSSSKFFFSLSALLPFYPLSPLPLLPLPLSCLFHHFPYPLYYRVELLSYKTQILHMLLDWRIVAASILENIKNEIIFAPDQERPMLAVVLVGENPASLAYIRMKERRAREVGMNFWVYRFPVSIDQATLEEEVQSLSRNEKIHGIIVQAPLPSHIDRYAVTECIDPAKDVDGFTKEQIGNMFLGHDGLWGCTPKGIMALLRYYHIDVKWKKVAVIGRSNIVGKPMTLMLINAGGTVTSCNSSTANIRDITRAADIVIVAVGKPRFLTKDMVHPGSIVIDVGSTFVDGVAYGDADFENLKDYIAAISPSPGGVGPMTVATLIENTWKAYEWRRRVKS